MMPHESSLTKRFVLIMLLLAFSTMACAAPTTTMSVESAIQEESTAADTAKQTDELPALTLGPNVDVQTVAAIMDRDDVLLLDVREQWEYDAGHIPNITLIPMGTVPDRLADIPRDKELIITCRSGNRSGRITNFLREQGYTNVHNMQGGMLAWEAAGFPVEK